MYLAYVGLGSNLPLLTHTGSRISSRELLTHAVQQLAAEHTQLQASSLYHSKPLGPQNQPDYLNAVVRFYSALPPEALLAYLQQVELAAGRERKQHWGARTLDLDILLMYQHNTMVTLHTPALTLPHVELTHRSFVVVPLIELDASLTVAKTLLTELPCATDSNLLKIAATAWWQKTISN